jgi:hypothetical protein
MLEFVIEKLIALLGPIATLSKEKRELKDNALRSVSTALRETQLYYRDLGKGKERSMDIEAQLAKYWSAAAIPLRHIDEELAMACEHKAEYWVNPEQWSDDIAVLQCPNFQKPVVRPAPNMALNLAPFGRWTLSDTAAPRRLALR